MERRKTLPLCVIKKQNTINSWVQNETDWSRIHLWSSLPPCIQKKRSIPLKNFATCSQNIYFHFHGFSVVFHVWKNNKITPKIDVSKALFYSLAPTMWEHWTCTRRKSSSTFFHTTVLHPNKIIKFSSRRGIWWFSGKRSWTKNLIFLSIRRSGMKRSKQYLIQDTTKLIQLAQLYQIQPCDIGDPPTRLRRDLLQIQWCTTCGMKRA